MTKREQMLASIGVVALLLVAA
jgi:type IV pilus assembly protein PilO